MHNAQSMAAAYKQHSVRLPVRSFEDEFIQALMMSVGCLGSLRFLTRQLACSTGSQFSGARKEANCNLEKLNQKLQALDNATSISWGIEKAESDELKILITIVQINSGGGVVTLSIGSDGICSATMALSNRIESVQIGATLAFMGVGGQLRERSRSSFDTTYNATTYQRRLVIATSIVA